MGEWVDLQNDIKLALLKLPNGVIDGVKVSVDYVEDDELFKLVSDNLFPAVSFIVDIVRAEDATDGAPQLTLHTDDQDTILAVGCKLSGAMVPRKDTAIAAVTSIPDPVADVLTFTSTYTADLSAGTDTKIFEVSAEVYCVKGSTVLTTATDDELAEDDWISVPACGIGAAQVSAAHGEAPAATGETIVNTPATVTVTSANSGAGVSAYALKYTCLLNGQIVARMALLGVDGGGGASAVIKKFVVGYGAILPGCKLMQADGTTEVTNAVVTVTSDATLIKIYDAYVNQEIYASSSSSQTFQCAQAYLPLDTGPTHTFTDGYGFTRGQSYDEL